MPRRFYCLRSSRLFARPASGNYLFTPEFDPATVPAATTIVGWLQL